MMVDPKQKQLLFIPNYDFNLGLKLPSGVYIGNVYNIVHYTTIYDYKFTKWGVIKSNSNNAIDKEKKWVKKGILGFKKSFSNDSETEDNETVSKVSEESLADKEKNLQIRNQFQMKKRLRLKNAEILTLSGFDGRGN